MARANRIRQSTGRGKYIIFELSRMGGEVPMNHFVSKYRRRIDDLWEFTIRFVTLVTYIPS